MFWGCSEGRRCDPCLACAQLSSMGWIGYAGLQGGLSGVHFVVCTSRLAGNQWSHLRLPGHTASVGARPCLARSSEPEVGAAHSKCTVTIAHLRCGGLSSSPKQTGMRRRHIDQGTEKPACLTTQTALFRNKPACAGGTSTKGWKSPACATIQTGLLYTQKNPPPSP